MEEQTTWGEDWPVPAEPETGEQRTLLLKKSGLVVSERKVARHKRRKEAVVIALEAAQGERLVEIAASDVWKLYQFLQGRYWV